MAQHDETPDGPDFAQGAPLTDLSEGGALAGHVGGEAALMSRKGDQVFIVAGACTHYGGPLAKGLIEGGRAHCPWHHACFDLATGKALAAPAFAPLKRWRVEVRDGKAFAGEALDDAPAGTRAAPGIERVVIVGGGAAGFACADRLRELGYQGALTVLSADDRAPYDRPNLSKDYLAGEAPDEWMPLKDAQYYANRRIDLKLQQTVSTVDTTARTVTTQAGETFAYDRLLLATGAEPVRLDTPGFDHAKVRTLRSMDDSDAIIARAQEAKHAVVIGASFIGLEVAAALRHRNVEVDVVAPEALPMERILGSELARLVTDLHKQHGVRFHLERKATGFDGYSIQLDDGSRLAADLVVVGVGVRPRIGVAKAAGLAVDKGVIVGADLQTSAAGVFAAGDIAAYPDPVTGEPARVEHWVAAERQGQIAAASMLGLSGRFTEAPFFWSAHYDLTIRYCGRGAGFDRHEVDGSADGRDCTVRYFTGERLIAAASVGRDRENLELALQLSRP